MFKTVILGPTGVGKSSYAVVLASQNEAEIVSVDSMQIYKYMNIGTAKPTLAEQAGIKHYMLDIVEPSVQYSVVDYLEEVKKIIAAGKKELIFCGGTGLYLNALFNGLNFPGVEKNDELRAELQKKDKQELWAELQKVDPEAAAKIHTNDSYRAIRALEVYKLTGRKFSAQIKKGESILGTDYKIIGLTTERKTLYQKLEARVDLMLVKGLEQEVRLLLEKGYSPELSSMQALGYKEMIMYIQGKCSLAEAVELIKKGTRNFAKRQYTWFRAFKNVEWREV